MVLISVLVLLVPFGLLRLVLYSIPTVAEDFMLPGLIDAFSQVFISLTLGLAVLWLLSHKLKAANRFVSVLGATAIMAIIEFFVVICAGVLNQSVEAVFAAIGCGIIYGIIVVIMMGELALAAVFSRKHYSAGRFVGWLLIMSAALCCVLFIPAALILVVADTLMYGFFDPFQIVATLFGTFLAGLVTWLTLCGMLLPFLILSFTNDLYRRRFYDIFRLPGMLAEPSAVPAAASLQMEGEADNEQTFRHGAL